LPSGALPCESRGATDISTAHLARLLGQDGLAAWLDDVPVEWQDLPFAAVAVCFSDLRGTSCGETVRSRPPATPVAWRSRGLMAATTVICD